MRIVLIILLVWLSYSSNAQFTEVPERLVTCDTCAYDPVFMGRINNELTYAVTSGKKQKFITCNEAGIIRSDSFAGLHIMGPVYTIGTTFYYINRNDSDLTYRLYKWNKTDIPQNILAPANCIVPRIFTTRAEKLYLDIYDTVLRTNAMYEYDAHSEQLKKITDTAVYLAFAVGQHIYYMQADAQNGKWWRYQPQQQSKEPATGLWTEGEYLSDFYNFNNKSYFILQKDALPPALYEYDGKTVVKLANVADKGIYLPSYSYSFALTFYQNRIYFPYYFATGEKNKLYYYDLETKTSAQLLDHAKWKILMSEGSCIYRGKIAFSGISGEPGSVGRNLFIYNTATDELRKVENGHKYLNSFGSLKTLRNTLYLSIFIAEYRTQLYRYEEEWKYDNPTIYPNPATTEAYVKLGTDTTQAFILTMYDAMGREIMWRNLGTFKKGEHTVTLPLQQLATGIYICTLRGSNRGIVLRQKLVKL